MKSLFLVLVTLSAIVTHSYGHHEPGHHDEIPVDKGSRVQAAMEYAEIVPDVVGKAPSQLIKVSVQWKIRVLSNHGDLDHMITRLFAWSQ